MILYHVTTERKARLYRQIGFIRRPVRGFDTLIGAMAWAIKTGRKVIYEISSEHDGGAFKYYKLPDHQNEHGEAWWIDGNVTRFKCVFSAGKAIKEVSESGVSL